MRATRAYIASAGTAAVMLGASLAMFVIVSGFVAFGSWPGSNSGAEVNQVVLKDVVAKAKPKRVSVRSDAVVRARRVERRRQVAVAKAGPKAGSPAATHSPSGTIPAGTPVAQAPTSAATPKTPSAPSATTSPQQTAQAIDNTTRQMATQVQQGAQNVATQVGEVVDQVIGGAQTQTTTTVGQVQDTAGGLLGH